jgi:3-deoxy-D-manno-octulosonate 8-phosphate phosphatase (KDO 8-P phosphatase)
MDPKDIQIIVLDVDGVLTDGGVTPGASGDAGKRFNVRDGLAIKMWRDSGGRVAILSGRHSDEVSRRAAELKIEVVRQKVADKRAGLRDVLQALDAGPERTAYIGDDVPDLPAMADCGFGVAVADAAPAMKKRAHFVTRRRGGEGAVAEFIEWLMRKQGKPVEVS